MPERTAAEVLAEKLKEAWAQANGSPRLIEEIARCAAYLAEDPAITVQTDLVVERFVVEIHRVPWPASLRPTADQMRRILTTEAAYRDEYGHRIIVRPYPESTSQGVPT